MWKAIKYILIFYAFQIIGVIPTFFWAASKRIPY